MKMKLELVSVPVSDVDRAKAFYVDKLGFHADYDQKLNEKVRFVQLTPSGSACSIVIGLGITPMKPGSLNSLLLKVDDIHKAHSELKKNGVEVTDVKLEPWGAY